MNLDELKSLLSQPRQIVLTSHTNPDGDALGSVLALFHYFSAKGHTVIPMVPTEMPDFLAWMPGSKSVLIYEHEEDKKNADRAVEGADIIFCLDYNSLTRIDDMAAPIQATQGIPLIMLDHHLNPDPFFDWGISETSASSTCELVYDFIGLLDDHDSMDELVMNSIYVGILTDTGAFAYATNPKLFRIVADLYERGVNNADMQDKVFNSYTEKRLRLLGFCLYERMEVFPEYHAGIIALSQEDHVKLQIKRGDMEGVINYILKLKDFKMAVLISERRQEVKLSMRSKGDFSVQQICSRYFNGGGHKNASGGSSNVSFAETVAKVKAIIPEYC